MDNTIFENLADDKLLALTIWGEASTQGTDGKMAVANVVKNRTKDASNTSFVDKDILSRTGSLWKAVILKNKQFSCFNASDAQRPKLETRAKNWDSNYQSDSNLQQSYNIANMAVNGILVDNTNGATHYFNPSLANPSWAKALDYIGNIGDHVFYSIYPAYQRVREEIVKVSSSPTGTIILGAIGLLFMGFFIVRRGRRSEV